jgi:hypothetical protein
MTIGVDCSSRWNQRVPMRSWSMGFSRRHMNPSNCSPRTGEVVYSIDCKLRGERLSIDNRIRRHSRIDFNCVIGGSWNAISWPSTTGPFAHMDEEPGCFDSKCHPSIYCHCVTGGRRRPSCHTRSILFVACAACDLRSQIRNVRRLGGHILISTILHLFFLLHWFWT